MQELQVVEFKNQRILTTQQLADSYETENKVINNNFANNKVRYTEGKHYFKLEGGELKIFLQSSNLGMQNESKIRTLYLWTEKGALLHAKSLNTDKAWEVYEHLVDTYYKVVKQKQLEVDPLKTKRLEIMEMNARTRQGSLMERVLSKYQNTLSKVAVVTMVAKINEVITGDKVIQLPETEKTYTATEIGNELGISANKVGRIATANNLKTDEYGVMVMDKSRHNNKEIPNFRYNEIGKQRIIEIHGGTN